MQQGLWHEPATSPTRLAIFESTKIAAHHHHHQRGQFDKKMDTPLTLEEVVDYYEHLKDEDPKGEEVEAELNRVSIAAIALA